MQVRNWDRAEQVLATLEDLGFAVPTGMKAAAAANSPLGPYKIYLHDLNRALANTTLKTHERIGIKTARPAEGDAMKRGQLEHLIAEMVADAVKPLIAENQELAAKLAATEAKIAACAEKMRGQAPAHRTSAVVAQLLANSTLTLQE